MGNIQSISNAFKLLDEEPLIVDNPDELSDVKGVVLPGVGAFGEGMGSLREKGFVTPLEKLVLEKEIPFLGVCLGMQFLATKSEEKGTHKGLDWISGTVRRIEPEQEGYEVPHMGWNDTRIRAQSPLYEGLGKEPVFYFAHSYHIDAAEENEKYVTADAYHGTWFTAGVSRDNIYGVQFHPEKSQGAGLKLIENFIDITEGEMNG